MNAIEPTIKFKFGENWKSYVQEHFSETTLALAEKDLATFLGGIDLRGKTFLDVGCGSGVHSLAALRLGAARVVSVDADPASVSCCRTLAEKTEARNWDIKEGSLLDSDFVDSLGTFDVVYCWGVAHHTGDMWRALQNLALPLKSGSVLFLAIYNTLEGALGSKTWRVIKRSYVHAPRFLQIVMEWMYIASFMLKQLLRLRNPFRVFQTYATKRGMSYKHDLIDWLGGYPYEHARVEEIFRFFHGTHGLQLENIKTTNFLGNNQFLFKKF